jgi:hypothetical protein
MIPVVAVVSAACSGSASTQQPGATSPPQSERTNLGYVAQEAVSLRDELDGDPDVADFARLAYLAAQLRGRGE